MVDRRQWILEFDEGAVGITQLVRRLVEVVVGVVAHQVSEWTEGLAACAQQRETISVVLDSHVRHWLTDSVYNVSSLFGAAQLRYRRLWHDCRLSICLSVSL